MDESSATTAINKRSRKSNTKVSNKESKTKIIKLSEVATNNMDPLVYFSCFLDIPEMILNHLRLFGKGLIIISKVSPLWYNVIASSKVLMENIKVVFKGNRELQKEDYDLLKNSSRKYQNIEVQRSSDGWRKEITELDCITNSELNFFLSKAREWKYVSIVETNFKTKLDLFQFLASIESSVESFSVMSKFNGNAFPFDDDPHLEFESVKTLKFPKLKHLKMHFDKFRMMGVIYARAFVEAVAIKIFDFKDNCSIVVNGSVLTKLLENSKNLTSLWLETNESDMFVDQTWQLFQFNLKSFAIISNRYSELLSTNLWEFIISQKDYLEDLSIDFGDDIEIFNNIMRLPKLKILDLEGTLTLSKGDVPNVISTSITQLKLSYEDPDTLKYYMKSMPNVKSLYLDEVDKKAFQALLEMNKKYEKLEVGQLVRGVTRKDLKVLLTNENDECVIEDWI